MKKSELRQIIKEEIQKLYSRKITESAEPSLRKLYSLIKPYKNIKSIKIENDPDENIPTLYVNSIVNKKKYDVAIYRDGGKLKLAALETGKEYDVDSFEDIAVFLDLKK